MSFCLVVQAKVFVFFRSLKINVMYSKRLLRFFFIINTITKEFNWEIVVTITCTCQGSQRPLITRIR